jgi:hypothetical protein
MLDLRDVFPGVHANTAKAPHGHLRQAAISLQVCVCSAGISSGF